MTTRSALLCLNVSKTGFKANIRAALKIACNHAKETIYVHMYSATDSKSLNDTDFSSRPPLSKMLHCTSQLYDSASSQAPLLNVTILQRYYMAGGREHRLRNGVQLLLVDGDQTESLIDIVKRHYHLGQDLPVIKYDHLDVKNALDSEVKVSSIQDLPEQTFDYCALGGTFDSIHNGHKVLLGAAIALSNKSLTIGVTDQSMNQKKTLYELINPIEDRKAAVRSYVEDVRPDIAYDIVTLHDAFGPTITDDKLQCIVVSDETDRGGDLINERRAGKGFPLMTKVCIPLVAGDTRSDHQEEKISSSTLREQRLGQCLRQPEARPHLPVKPYLIGLTGGIASGKSSVGKRLEGLGAGLVSSDLLAHKAYEKGSEAFNQVVETFGRQILNPETGEIERRKLGEIVFGDKSKLSQLNEIVWPATAKLVHERVAELFKQGKEVCYIEAALLLEASWSSQLHEVWSCIIPEKEALNRLRDRNGLSEEEAIKRIKSQAGNQFRVDNSNVVLCTLWDYDVTQKQVEKAWGLLQERIQQSSSNL